jgi:CHAT domain-containing protein
MGLGDFREFLGEEDGDSSNEVPSATIPVAIDSVESQRGARLADSSNRTSSLPSRVAMDLVQSLNRMGVDSIATILWGGGTIQQSHKLVGDILRGFLDAYSDVAMDRLHLRRVILCETNAVAYTELRKSLAMHLLSNRFRDGDFVLNEIRIRSSEQVRGEVRKSQQEKRPRVYLLATALDKDAVNNEQFQMELRLLGHAHKGAISADTIEVDRATISDFINQAKVDRRASLSKKFSEAFLGSRMVSDLSKSLDDGDPAIVVLHDDATASIPWELMGEKEPWAVKYGVSRTAIVDGTARFLQERRRHKVLHVLLAFSNPKEDLPGGEEELAKLAAVFAAKMDKGIQVTRLEPRESTKSRLLEELGSGNYDVFHYIGHAKFGERIGDQRGIYCKDKDYLTGKDLGQLRMLPTLVFLNACESVRTYRESKDEAKRKLVERQSEPRSEWEKNPSLALGLLQAGIAQLIGTYWSVGDDDAPLFAATLYQEILKGSSTGDAIRVARGALLKKPSVDWANYMHYGDPSFKIKDPTG